MHAFPPPSHHPVPVSVTCMRRYEGEFDNSRMQGYGVYVWKDGT